MPRWRLIFSLTSQPTTPRIEVWANEAGEVRFESYVLGVPVVLHFSAESFDTMVRLREQLRE